MTGLTTYWRVMEEELFSEDRFVRIGEDLQSELIARHCAEVEDRIRTASSRPDAERVSAEACSRFREECPSALLRNALTRRVEELVNKYWRAHEHSGDSNVPPIRSSTDSVSPPVPDSFMRI